MSENQAGSFANPSNESEQHAANDGQSTLAVKCCLWFFKYHSANNRGRLRRYGARKQRCVLRIKLVTVVRTNKAKSANIAWARQQKHWKEVSTQDVTLSTPSGPTVLKIRVSGTYGYFSHQGLLFQFREILQYCDHRVSL